MACVADKECDLSNIDILHENHLADITSADVNGVCENRSWNKTDRKGVFGIVLVTLGIGGGVTYLCNGSSYAISLCLICFLILLYLFIVHPMNILHIPSSIITMCTNTPPYLNKNEYFPYSRVLERPENWRIMRKELDAYLASHKRDALPFMDSVKGTEFVSNTIKPDGTKQKDWRIIPILMGNKIVEQTKKDFPFTTNLITHPDIVTAMFSVLEPGTQIPPHCGYYKGIIRYHLGMIIPRERDKVFICVNQKKYHWREGEGVLSDDLYAHQVYNYSDELRIVLFLDVVRPLSEPLNTMNRYVCKIVSNSSFIADLNKKLEKQMPLKSS